MKSILTILLVLCCTVHLWGQEPKLVQFTGRVFNEYVQPMPFVSVAITNRGIGTITDKQGKFSFVTKVNDTILFSSMGFKKAQVIIPDSLDSKFFTRDILMESDTFMIEAVEVYPWKDYEEFTEAFINLKLPDDDLDRARKNIALIQEQLAREVNPMPVDNYRYMMDQHTYKSFNRGTVPTYQVFNIMAWAKFFEALKNGDFKDDRKDK